MFDVEFLASAANPQQFPPETFPEYAFLGRSNVGKSSLLNRLAGKKKLAFVSSTPGRTQTINFFRVGSRLCLVDLPGYGYARVPKSESAHWKELADAYLLRRQTLELSLLLIDSRRGWMEPDRALREYLEYHQRPYLVVATKIDKLNRKEEEKGMREMRAEVPGREVMPFSALSGRGVREIWQTITKTKS
ncbi:ribosome biogenesis GTP-binding protein YihA/YsxC [Bryobacter aggregatus]|uniref:ribosome biogenesis GTP-binding protein YihA/YsxC n=1 Tax=Bryobacter aggregatus TaxID=360054 RepID=UPI0004E0C1BD|nr:ribosome biogenesis GTP-binding protein YihA/YsxC [Bryobacter aggregatus]